MRTSRDSNRPPMLWTPWGEQKITQPGEKFAALRRLALKLRQAQHLKLAQEQQLSTSKADQHTSNRTANLHA